METNIAPLFPEVGGTEEETRIDVIRHDVEGGKQLDGDYTSGLIKSVDPFCGRLPGSLEFRRNGAKFYNDTKGLEVATAESDNPLVQVACIRANAELVKSGMGLHAQTLSKRLKCPVEEVWQRRVIDDEGHTWACHDNYSFANAEFANSIHNTSGPTAALLHGFVITRPFITGAGLITSNGLYYSQKLSRPYGYSDYGFSSTLFRTDAYHGNRLEVRSNDINLKDWAMIARIGGMALVQAASQTSLLHRLANLARLKFTGQPYNVVNFDDNLQLTGTRQLKRAVRFQRSVIEIILEDFDNSSKQAIPEIYRHIGESIIEYCDDFDRVIDGQDDMSILIDRSDWASKLSVVRQTVWRQLRSGKTDATQDDRPRTMTDARSRSLDKLYDRFSVKSSASGRVISHGYGYKLAARHSVVDSADVARAQVYPPTKTRAKDRVDLVIDSLPLSSRTNWHIVTVDSPDGTFTVHELNSMLSAAA